MDKKDIKQAMLDRPYKTQIVLSRYLCEEEPEYDMGWECDIFHEDGYIGGGTAPTYTAIHDLAQEIIYDYEHPRDF